jgi:hypothetical protein
VHHRAKYLGIFLFILGCFFCYTYFNIGKPEWLNIKVFALVSFYVKRTYFSMIQTNIIDELGALFIILGLLLFFFAKQKEEKKIYTDLRIKAIVNSIWISSVIWMIAFITIYGVAIFLISSAIFLIFLLISIIYYYILLFRYKRNSLKNEAQLECGND